MWRGFSSPRPTLLSLSFPAAAQGAPGQAGGTELSPRPSPGQCSAPSAPPPPSPEPGPLPAASGPRGCSARGQRGAGTAPASSSSPARHQHPQLWATHPAPPPLQGSEAPPRGSPEATSAPRSTRGGSSAYARAERPGTPQPARGTHGPTRGTPQCGDPGCCRGLPLRGPEPACPGVVSDTGGRQTPLPRSTVGVRWGGSGRPHTSAGQRACGYSRARERRGTLRRRTW